MRKLVTVMTALAEMGIAASAAADDAQPNQPGGDAALGGPGESCRARADCRTGLKCVASTCVDEHEGQACGATAECGAQGLKCIDQKCTSGKAPKKKKRADDEGGAAGGGGDEGGGGTGESAMQGTHPFVGLAWMGGPALPFATGNGASRLGSASGSFLFGLRGGVQLGRNELALEISPMTYTYGTPVPGPSFQLNGSYAGMIPMYESKAVSVYWPMRVGLGFVAGNTPADLALLQFRLDLIGTAIKIALPAGSLMIDLHLPSFRYLFTSSNGATFHSFAWLPGGSISYVF